MAAIAHASRVNVTNQTTTSGTYVDATNGDISSGSFTAGDKYLLLAMAQLGNTPSATTLIRVVHGSTAFADSEMIAGTFNSTLRCHYFWWTVWTAVGGEDVNVQYTSTASSTALPSILSC